MLKIEFKNSLEDISKILESENAQEKIRILETLHDTNNLKILQQIILRLNDDSIQVRGEAFNSLLLNQNNISKILIDNLNSSNKNIKSFTALVLANRNEKKAIPEIIKLVNNKHGMVRSCAIGSLGYLKADKITGIILNAFSDSNLDVQKSALNASPLTSILLSFNLEIICCNIFKLFVSCRVSKILIFSCAFSDSSIFKISSKLFLNSIFNIIILNFFNFL